MLIYYNKWCFIIDYVVGYQVKIIIFGIVTEKAAQFVATLVDFEHLKVQPITKTITMTIGIIRGSRFAASQLS